MDVPELKYFAAEDRGEVCFRGAGVMSGYYSRDSDDNEETRNAIDEQVKKHNLEKKLISRVGYTRETSECGFRTVR